MNPAWLLFLVPFAWYVGTLFGLANERLRREKPSVVLVMPVMLLAVLLAATWWAT